jgi:hypothetical protein
MTTSSLKKELHKVIDMTEDTILLEAIYTLLNSKSISDLSPEQYSLVEERRQSYKKGKIKTVSLAEVRKKATLRNFNS